LIAGYQVPYISRLINGEHLKLVSVRMAETQLLSFYLYNLHETIFKCTSVRSYFITDSEAKLLNDINQNHSDCMYGTEMFLAGKDYIVRLDDVIELYTFVDVCFNLLMCNYSNPDIGEKCGFIRINNSVSIVPYCIIDNQKYVPLFYFEGRTENLSLRAEKLEHFNLAYLKFCCKVQGLRNDILTRDSWTVVNFDYIKNYYPPETSFEEFWPSVVNDTQLIINPESTHVSVPSVWIRAPPEVAPAENTIPHTLTAPAQVLPQSMPVIMNTYQNGSH